MTVVLRLACNAPLCQKDLIAAGEGITRASLRRVARRAGWRMAKENHRPMDYCEAHADLAERWRS